MSRSAELEREDQAGQPYRVLRHMDYEAAVAVARSPHPRRMLTHTGGYRFGHFTETGRGAVTVDMMGSRIAEFRPDGVALSSCGWVTETTTQALSMLVSGGWFVSRDQEIYFRRYSSSRQEHRHRDGQVYPYVSRSPS